MTKLDDLGRRHASVVKNSLDGAVPPARESVTGIDVGTATSTKWTAAVGVAALIAVVVGALALFNSPQADEPVAQETPTTTLGVESTATPTSVQGFDMNFFISSSAADLFGEDYDRVGVVVLVPTDQAEGLESTIAQREMTELVGLGWVQAHDVRPVLDAFAEEHDMEKLGESWTVLGLEPKYADSPVDEWVAQIDGFGGAVAQAVPFTPAAIEVPPGWRTIAQLPFSSEWEVVVEGVGDGVMVLGYGPARFVSADGSVREGQLPPEGFPGPCCGDFESHPTPKGVVITKPETGTSWLVDMESLNWMPLPKRPLTRRSLGSAVVDQQLVVVERAGRSIVAESRVVALDLQSLEWSAAPSMPGPIDVGDVTTDGSSVYVAGVPQDLNGRIVGTDREPRFFAALPGAEWRQLESVPIDGQAATVGWVPEVGLLAWNYDLAAALWTEQAGWREIADVPINEGECYPSLEFTRHGAVGQCSEPVYFDGETVEWATIRQPFRSKLAVTDDAIYALMDTGRDKSLFIAFDLPPE